MKGLAMFGESDIERIDADVRNIDYSLRAYWQPDRYRRYPGFIVIKREYLGGERHVVQLRHEDGSPMPYDNRTRETLWRMKEPLTDLRLNHMDEERDKAAEDEIGVVAEDFYRESWFCNPVNPNRKRKYRLQEADREYAASRTKGG